MVRTQSRRRSPTRPRQTRCPPTPPLRRSRRPSCASSSLGPSRLEEDLSTQRSEALERADRAERSAFEALAETARIVRERDRLKAETERLQQEVARLESELTGVGYRVPGD